MRYMNCEAMHLNIQLLGPLNVELKATQMTPSAPKQRQVLALLALNAGRVVTVSTLIEELWGDRPPRSYATTLQTYVLQIRNALAAALPGVPAVRGVLSTRHSGYQLEAGCRTDVEELTRLGIFERRVEADLALGRHNDMLGELTLASARNPMNEILSAYLMIALYR